MAELVITTLAGFGLATILPRRDTVPDALGAALGLTFAAGPMVSRGDSLALIGTGPRQWLAFTPTAAPDWPDALARSLDGIASVIDQSGSVAIHALTGDDARRLLQSGLGIDLDPIALPADAVVVSAIAHIGVTVWQDADRWLVAVPLSFAGSFARWLELAGAPTPSSA